MKALKYGLTLLLGLSVCGFGTRVSAQASGQTAEVVPANANPLPDVPATQTTAPTQQQEQPQRGVPTPKAVEALVNNGEYTKAVEEFEKFIKTVKGNQCDMSYLPYTFYDRLLVEDTSRTAYYQEKVKFYADKFLSTCSNTVEAYLMKDSQANPRIPDSTIVWMTRAISLDKNYAILYTMRGEALWELKRTKEACADFEKAVGMNDGYAKEFYDMNCVETSNPEASTPESAPVQ